MGLTPSGKIREMVAQTYFNPLYETEKDKDSSFNTEEVMNEDIGVDDGISSSNGNVVDNSLKSDDLNNPKEGNEDLGDSSGKKNTLTNYVFNKLKNYGYPGRRLQEFKPKFVKEKVTADGEKDVQIEIPDKKYPGPDGIADTIENDDLKEIVNEINKQFGLNFNGADRSDGKWVIKFTSQKLSEETSDNIVKDNLDEVYGTPSKGKKQGKDNKIAFTVQELINQNKNSLVEHLKNIKG